MSRPVVALFLLLALGGCDGRTLPYDAWYLGVLAPNYMEVWLEDATVVDMQDKVYPGAMKGIPAMGESEDLSETAKGWPQRIGSGKGRYLRGLALPRTVYVRWQSLVEPQTYRAVLEIPEWARQAMVKREPAHCPVSGRTFDYRESLTLGLAPGGIVKVWIKGPCLDPIEVLRVQAEVEPKGPDQGQMNGRYALPLSDTVQAYIRKYGVPYGSW